MRLSILLFFVLVSFVPCHAEDTPLMYINRRTNVLGLSRVADPALVASAALFTTRDNGQSWQLAQEIIAPSDGKSFPKFSFTSPNDETVGLYSRTVFRSGHREADPQAGTQPLYILVIDTTSPIFSTAEASIIDQQAATIRFRSTWILNEINPSDPAVTIETAIGDGSFVSIASVTSKGSMEHTLTIPLGVTSLSLRFVAKDRAGNETTSAVTKLSLAPPRLAADARNAIAQAVKDMPTIAQLRDAPRATTPPKSNEIKAPTTASTPAPVSAAPAPEKPPVIISQPVIAPIPDIYDGRRSAPQKYPYIHGAASDDLLRNARVALRFKRYDDALEMYDQVLSSSHATEGLHDLIDLYGRLECPKDVCTVVQAQSTELLDDYVRVGHGRALVALNRHTDAEKVLMGIGSHGPEAREARYLIALCWRAAGKNDEAKKVFTALASGNDLIATHARDQLAGR